MKFGWSRRLTALSLLSGLTLLLRLATGLVQAQEPGWSEPVSLSENFPQSYLPDMAADQAGNLYAVWVALFEERDRGWGDGIGFAMWDGRAWSPAVDIFAEIDHLPSIAVDSRGRLHLIGIGYTRGPPELWYSQAWAQQRPTNAPAWSDLVNLSNGYAAYWNDIVVDSRDWIHVVFASYDPSLDPDMVDGQVVDSCCWLFYTRSTDGGHRWSTPVEISPRMAANPKVVITKDGHDNLYVVWGLATYDQPDGTLAPSTSGFTYSTDGGTSWSEAEVQAFDTRAAETGARRDCWLSLAVDSQQTIHLVARPGELFLHFYKEGLNGPWIEDTIPQINVEDLGPGYGFRQIAVDNSDNLHFLCPTGQRPRSQTKTPPGLFHAVWNRASGWSSLTRATTNRRGKGCGFGNLAVSGGNQLHVVWFEHLEGSSGHLYEEPRGKIEIYHAHLETGARSIPLVPLPPMPTPTATMPTAQPVSTTQVTTSVRPRVMSSSATTIAADSMSSAPAPASGLTTGIGIAILVLGISVSALVVRSRMRKGRSRRKRRRKRKYRPRPYYISRVEVLAEDPHPQVRLKRDLGGRLRLLGYNPPANPLRAGECSQVTYYWQVLDGFAAPFDVKLGIHPERVETHRTDYVLADRFVGAAGEFSVLHLPTYLQMPPQAWQPGQVIREIYDFRLPADARGEYDWSVGLYAVPRALGIQVNSERQVPGIKPISLGKVWVTE